MTLSVFFKEPANSLARLSSPRLVFLITNSVVDKILSSMHVVLWLYRSLYSGVFFFPKSTKELPDNSVR